MSARLDASLVARGLARSRGQACDLIAAGRVRVNGAVAAKPSARVAPSDDVRAEVDPYVSRAAHKLLGALDDSTTRVAGRALDAGASTGGFTQVLLERGCAPVYAVDVGHGQLAEPVASDPRVLVREGLNLRDLSLRDLDGTPVDVCVADVSFISLTLILRPLLSVLADDGVALLMVKPQFEVGRGALDAHGVVQDAALAEQAVERVLSGAEDLGWACTWRGLSALPGEAGNREHFVRLERSAPEVRLST